MDETILGKEVEVPAIDTELRQLWEVNKAFTKASLINFAVYSEQPDALTYNTPLIAEITREHACRAILIDARLDEKESRVRAWITAHCNLVDGRKAVCSEQISFQLDGKAIGRIRNIVFAHLESDLPLVLWWQGEFSRIFEPQFYYLIDRLIFDSHDWANPLKSYTVLQKALENAPQHIAIHDLAWTRSYEIRATLAALFDDKTALAELANLNEICISHAPGHRTSAVLILAWLAHQLHWRYDDSTKLFRTLGNKTIQYKLKRTEGCPISSVKMDSEKGSFHITREPDSHYLRSKVKIGEAPETCQITPADVDSLAELVSRQMARGATNQLIRRILPTLLDLL